MPFHPDQLTTLEEIMDEAEVLAEMLKLTSEVDMRTKISIRLCDLVHEARNMMINGFARRTWSTYRRGDGSVIKECWVYGP